MANEPKPMNPERLADMRTRVACGRRPQIWFAELLADRDYHAQRAEQLERERDEYEAACQAKHVERAGVTRSRVEEWLRANGWHGLGWDRFGWVSATAPDSAVVDLWRTDGSTSTDLTVRFIADHLDRPSMLILDEMAVMETDRG
jgi:hypothetical protein